MSMTTTLSREAALAALDQQLCRASFVEFLSYIKVRSDDPYNPGPIPWKDWEYLHERAAAWEAGESEVILKARQLGMTWLFAAYANWCARNGKAVGAFSAGQVESRAILDRVRYIEEYLPPHLKANAVIRSDDASYPSGGSIRVFPSTEHAGISFTFQVVAFDEAHFHPYGAQNYAAVRPTLSAGGQFLMFSTADPTLGPNGFFHDMYWASERGETPYKSVFIPWHARPGRDDEWMARERAAFTGLPEEFDAFYPSTPESAFVARSGLVFPQFSTVRHVKPAPTPLENCRRIVAGVDFGGGDPTAVVILGLDASQHIHQYAEFYKRGSVGVDEIGNFLSNYRVDAVMCDPSQQTSIATLVGTYNLPARKADNRRGDGLGLMAFLLDNDRLTIEPSNVHSIQEFPGYRWSNRTDPNDKTRYATATPVNNHADAMDARRYAIAECLAMLMPRKRMPTRSLSGVPLSRRAV